MKRKKKQFLRPRCKIAVNINQVGKRESEQAVDRLYARNLMKNNCIKLRMPQNLCNF